MPDSLPLATLRRPRIRLRRRLLLGLALFVVLAGIAWGGMWYLTGLGFETTDDAYVGGDVVQITSEVAGTVTALHADDTQQVRRGQLLVELDPADAEIAMAAARAGLAQAVRQVRGLFARADQLRAQLAEREAATRRAQADLKRRATLAANGAISAEELAHARDTLAELAASADAARGQLQETIAATAGTTLTSNALVLDAAARLRNAALALRRTRIVAPVDGVVAKRSVQLGERLAPGTPLMAVVPLGDVWIDANFKERQLERMRVGQPVRAVADLYGDDVVYRGKVAGLSAGSGTAFSLLPAQNATGNWIKIVQRLPVRILLDADELAAHPLRIGLSASVRVDVREASGPLVAGQLRNQQMPDRPSDAADPEIDAMIARIIEQNSGQ
ncbi:MAG: efflux RND transporter periplasmic adaptor subunit [Acidisphaera sp.]|nr:efflux RND transporter periplasmic adaptor subunit [Acidisphaera sp.]